MFTNVRQYYSHWMLAGIFLFTPFFMPGVHGEYIPKGDETARVDVRIGGDRGHYRHYRKGSRGRVIYDPYYRGYDDRRYRDRKYHDRRHRDYDRHDRYDRRGDAGFQFKIK